jgi:hypothetical protein
VSGAREIRLPEDDDLFGRVGVLDRQITGIAGQERRGNGSLPALSDFDHFGDINEMILDPLPAVETGHLRLGDDLLAVRFHARRFGQDFGAGGAIAGTAGMAGMSQKHDNTPVLSHFLGEMGHFP